MFEKLDGFFTGTDWIPTCAIATQIEHIKAKRQLEEAQAKQAETKRARAEKEELQRLGKIFQRKLAKSIGNR